MANAPLSASERAFFETLVKVGELEDDRLSPNTKLLLGISEQDVKSLPVAEEQAAQIDEELRTPEEADEDLREEENAEVIEPTERQISETNPLPSNDEEIEEEQNASQPEEFVDESFRDEELPPEPSGPQPKPEPEPPGRDRFGSLFTRRKAHPVVIAGVLSSRYGDDWVKWEPETLWWAIRKDFGSIGELNRNKVMALRVALQTGHPWTDWDVFENCGLAWNDHIPIFGAYQPISPAEVAFTVAILKKLRPEFEFEIEAVAYMGAICEDAGFVFAPAAWFPGVQKLIDRKKWIGPIREDVKSMWSRVKGLGVEAFEDVDFRPNNPVDIHIAKLLAVREYLTARDMERKEQLRAPQK